MNRRKLLRFRHIVACGLAFLIGSLILIYGYCNAHTNTQEQGQITSEKKEQQVTLEQQSIGQIKDFPSPVRGNIIREIGSYRSESLAANFFHAGIDYAEPEGTVIRATHRGKVICAGPDLMLGQKVTLDCGEGWLITYGGLDNLRVHTGDIVESQDLLGQVGFFPGAEGLNGQSQLHYEIWQADKVQRPVQEIN